jgi:hypothetical protein
LISKSTQDRKRLHDRVQASGANIEKSSSWAVVSSGVQALGLDDQLDVV